MSRLHRGRGGHVPVDATGSEAATPSTDWTREFDVLVWCEWCQNYRSEKHTIEHAAIVNGTTSKPLKPWQKRCACGNPRHRHSDRCRSCQNAERL